MEGNLYLNLAKAELVCDIQNKRVNMDNLKYYHRQINDESLFVRFIYEVTKCLNKDKLHNNISDVILHEKPFIHNIIKGIQNVCKRDIDVSFYTELWTYLIYVNINNKIDTKLKYEYLNGISITFHVDKYFVLEYYNSMMDNIMSIIPIDVERLNYVKNKVKEII